jgi:hypothetical protein
MKRSIAEKPPARPSRAGSRGALPDHPAANIGIDHAAHRLASESRAFWANRVNPHCPATIKMGVRDNQDGNLVTGLSS